VLAFALRRCLARKKEKLELENLSNQNYKHLLRSKTYLKIKMREEMRDLAFNY
jgi:hypothetical protein